MGGKFWKQDLQHAPRSPVAKTLCMYAANSYFKSSFLTIHRIYPPSNFRWTSQKNRKLEPFYTIPYWGRVTETRGKLSVKIRKHT